MVMYMVKVSSIAESSSACLLNRGEDFPGDTLFMLSVEKKEVEQTRV